MQCGQSLQRCAWWLYVWVMVSNRDPLIKSLMTTHKLCMPSTQISEYKNFVCRQLDIVKGVCKLNPPDDSFIHFVNNNQHVLKVTTHFLEIKKKTQKLEMHYSFACAECCAHLYKFFSVHLLSAIQTNNCYFFFFFIV